MENQGPMKTSHFIISFAFFGIIFLVCSWIWQGKELGIFLTELFNLNSLLEYILIGILLGILTAIIAVVLVKITKTKLPMKENKELIDMMKQKYGALLVGFFPGIFEELLFRGFLLLFFQSFMSTIWAVVASTFIFWILHVPQYKLKIVLNFNVIMLSITASILLIQTGTIWASIVLHIVYNYLVSLAVQKKLIEA